MRAFMVIKGFIGNYEKFQREWQTRQAAANEAAIPDSRKWAIALAGRVCADMWRIFQHLHRAIATILPCGKSWASVPLERLKAKGKNAAKQSLNHGEKYGNHTGTDQVHQRGIE